MVGQTTGSAILNEQINWDDNSEKNWFKFFWTTEISKINGYQILTERFFSKCDEETNEKNPTISNC